MVVTASGPPHSVLFDDPPTGDVDERAQPEFFPDLRLDQVVAAVTSGRDEYNLKPFFHAPLDSTAAVAYRHAVFRDLRDAKLVDHVNAFAQRMKTMRAQIRQGGKLHYAGQRRRWFLEAVLTWCEAVRGLDRDLAASDLRSAGLLGFRAYLAEYASSEGFRELSSGAEQVLADLDQVRYSLLIQGNRIRVNHYESQADYGADVLATFDRFKQRAVKDHAFEFSTWPDMNHVEAAVLGLVARLFPEVFASLEQFAERHAHYMDATILRFDREIQFYLAWLEYERRFRQAGLSFCFPEVSRETKAVAGRDVFDLALADRLLRENAPLVTNEFHLGGEERILVVSGPNQGGKTTFARTFGQLHYLAVLGCTVPGSEAALYLFDRLFTHFEREEDLQNLSGKLENDLVRIHAILQEATSDSLLIMNESFSSTTVNDALVLSRRIMEQIIERDMLCVSVTFLDELASLGPSTVSMMSTVDPDDPALRTFRIIRRPADGLAYAAAIAEKYGLTYDGVRRRITA